MDSTFQAELRKIFDEQAQRIINKMREDLAVLSEHIQGENNDVPIKDLLRYAHTLRGSSGIVGLKKMEEIAVALQEILIEVKEARVELNTDIILLVTEGVGACEKLLTQDEVPDNEELMGRLRKTAGLKAEKSTTAVSKTTAESENTRLKEGEERSNVSVLVAAAAHELNNPMMGIINFVQYCLKHTSKDDKRHTVLQDTEHEVKRCLAIVEKLVAFSGVLTEGQERREKASCTATPDRTLKSLSYNIEREKVSVTHHYAEGLPGVWMTVNKIEQTFLHIINNALDALKESEKKEIHIEARRKGEFVQVTISDSGTGVTPGHLRDIFQPFFSTKPGEAGIGLSVSLNNIEKHGGKITCESKPGQGAKFEILLPVDLRRNRREQNGQKHFSD